jgi:hypothetical protein
MKTVRAAVECRVPDSVTEKDLVLTLRRILLYPIQLGFKGDVNTLAMPKFKSYSRVRTYERRQED